MDAALERAREAIDLHLDGVSEERLAESGALFDLRIEYVDVSALSDRRGAVSSAAD